MRMMNDVGMLQDIAVTAFFPMLAKALIVAGMIALMFWMNASLALIAVVVFPLFWLRSISLSRRMREVAKKQRRQEGAMAATVAESVQAIKTVQALSLEDTFARAFSTQSEKTLTQDVKGTRLAAALERSLDVLIALATALVLWHGTRLVLNRQATPGELLVFLDVVAAGLKTTPRTYVPTDTGDGGGGTALGAPSMMAIPRLNSAKATLEPSVAMPYAWTGLRSLTTSCGDAKFERSIFATP